MLKKHPPKGLPRPLCPARRKPIPWNVDHDDDGGAVFSVTHKHRTELIEHYRLCQICGKSLYKNAVFFIDVPSGHIIDQGGLHRRCAKLSLAHCNFLCVPAKEYYAGNGHADDQLHTVLCIYAKVEEVMKVDESEDRLGFPVWEHAPSYMRSAQTEESDS